MEAGTQTVSRRRLVLVEEEEILLEESEGDEVQNACRRMGEVSAGGKREGRFENASEMKLILNMKLIRELIPIMELILPAWP